MNLGTEREIQAESSSARFSLRRSRVSASTRSVATKSEVDRYAAAACSLMLMVVLLVGAAGYAGVRWTFLTATAIASAAPEAKADSARVAGAAVALALIAALMVAIAAAPGRITATESSRRRNPRTIWNE